MHFAKVQLLSVMLATASASYADVEVKTEQLNPASLQWEFKDVPGPSKSDVAENAKVTISGNQWEPAGGDGSVLLNGRMPSDIFDLSEENMLSNANADGGSILIDLGKVQPVAAVNSYSWHEHSVDQGSRGPQVYALYGSGAQEQPDPKNLSAWTKIADVDTRPNKTGVKWNGQHGVSITDSTGKIGGFRFLMFVVQRTRSPLQSNVNITATLFSEIDVHTKTTLARAGDAIIVQPAEITDVWVVFKTHLDVGYTHTIEETLKLYRVNMMDSALGLIEKDRQLPAEKRFSWTLAGWPLDHVLGPRQDPARKARIEQAVREGSIAVHAIPFTYYSETADLEDLVRGLGFASGIARKYGRPMPISAKMTDVPSHSWVWPTILSHAGVKFLQLGCNPISTAVRVPSLFWWEGPDGSRILCNYSPYYGSGIKPPRDWPSKNYLAMIMTGDNQGPPSPGDVENIRKIAEKSMPGAKIHIGTLDDFANAVIAENLDLTLVRADMPDTWIHGWLSMPIEAKVTHNLQPLEPALDGLDTQLRLWGLTPDELAPALAKAYELSNLFSEHTWGPHAPNAGSWNSHTPRYVYGDEWKAAYEKGAYKKYEQAFDDKRAFAHQANEIVQRELAARLDLLAKNVTAADGDVVVYNALPWKRSGIVEIDGKQLLAKDVPACGYKTVSSEQSGASAGLDNTTLDTRFFKIVIDLKRGGIASLVDKATGKELVDKSSPYALGQFLHERFDAQQMLAFHQAYGRPGYSWFKGDLPENTTYAALTPGDWRITTERCGAADMVKLIAGDVLGLAKGMSITFTFPRNQPSVKVEWSVTEKTPDPLPEGGWICFPFAVSEPKFLLGRLGGPIDPACDIVPGANRHLFCVSTGVTVSDKQGQGMGLCPIDSNCVSLGEPGLWKFSYDYVPTHPSVFVNLYNNEWNTNFPEWIDGTWSSRIVFWPLQDANTAEELTVKSWEARLPLLGAAANGRGSILPAEQAGLEVSRKGVLVTAFGADPDGVNKGTLLRVWEQAGVSGKLTVKLPGAVKASKATPVNLRGEKIGKTNRVLSGKLEFELGAYAPASFMLE